MYPFKRFHFPSGLLFVLCCSTYTAKAQKEPQQLFIPNSKAQLIKRLEVNNSNIQVDLGGFSKGLYFIRNKFHIQEVVLVR